MLFADSDPPPQMPPWVAVILALGGVSGIAGGVVVLVGAFIRVKKYYLGERLQTVRDKASLARSERKQRIEDESLAVQRVMSLYELKAKEKDECDRLHREEVDAMDRAHAAEVADLRREIDEVKEEHSDCRVRVARLEEAMRLRGWDIPEDTSKPATPPEKREPPELGRGDPRN